MEDTSIRKTRNTLVNEVTNTIINNIISGKYKEDEKIPNEFQLAEELNVSRTSIREAMKVLSAIGAVEIRRGDGTYISSQMDTALFDKLVYSMIGRKSSSTDLLELREVFDETTLYFAMFKITEEEIRRLEENVHSMAIAIKNNEVETIQAIDYQFHMELAKSCRNEYYYHIVEGVYSIFEKAMYQSIATETSYSKAAIYHKQMVDCLKNKDVKNIHKVVLDSLDTWREQL